MGKGRRCHYAAYSAWRMRGTAAPVAEGELTAAWVAPRLSSPDLCEIIIHVDFMELYTSVVKNRLFSSGTCEKLVTQVHAQKSIAC